MMNEKRIVIGFFILVVLLGCFILFKVIPPIHFHLPVEMTIMKQNGQIFSITNQRNPSYTQVFRVPDIDFPEGTEWKHRSIGPYGHQTDFFADFITTIIVKKEGTYYFDVASDDGFQLWIDNKLIGEFLTNRPFTTNQYNIYLNAGDHSYRLNYYQGFGRLGLSANYQFFGDNQTYFIGNNSSFLNFR